MSSERVGVQANILAHAPKGVYVHCASRCFNLVISHACSLQSIRNMIDKVKQVCIFFNYSLKPNGLLSAIIQEQHPENGKKEAYNYTVCNQDGLLELKHMIISTHPLSTQCLRWRSWHTICNKMSARSSSMDVGRQLNTNGYLHTSKSYHSLWFHCNIHHSLLPSLPHDRSHCQTLEEDKQYLQSLCYGIGGEDNIIEIYTYQFPCAFWCYLRPGCRDGGECWHCTNSPRNNRKTAPPCQCPSCSPQRVLWG